jgi:Tol biopolymer transport system component/DNA-binding winged helix-turn-helix (wHTH) protein
MGAVSGSEFERRSEYRLGEWIVRPSFNSLASNGTVERLEPQVMNVLNFLAANSGRVVSRDDLIEACWGGMAVTDDAVTRCISRLRNVFRATGGDPSIETIPKRGYCLVSSEERPVPLLGASPDRSPRGNILWAALVAAAAAIGAALFLTDAPAPPAEYKAEPRPLTADAGSEVWPTLSRDGAYLAYVVRDEARNQSSIWIRPVAQSARAQQITRNSYRERSLAWSPEGSRLAFVRQVPSEPCRIMIIAVPGASEREVARCAGDDPVGLDWLSEDSLVISDRSPGDLSRGLFAVALADGRPARLTRNSHAGSGDRFPKASADGRHVAFLRGGDIFTTHVALLDRSSGKVRILASGFETISGMDWEPGYQSLLVSAARGRRNGLWRVGMDGSLTELAGPSTKLGGLSLDGRGNLAFEHWIEVHNIAEIDLDRAGEPKILDGSTTVELDPAYSPDGRSIAMISSRSGKQEIWLAGGDRRRQLTRLEADDLFLYGWDPGGKQLLFAMREGSKVSLRSVRADDGMVRSIVSDDPSTAYSAAWSKDGESVYFSSNRDGPMRIWNINLLTRQMRPVSGPNRSIVIASPDGRWLYLTDGRKPRIWRMPAGGGPEQLVVEPRAFDGQSWQPTDRAIFYLSRPSGGPPVLKRFDLATRTERTIPVPADLSPYPVLAVRPDEAAFIIGRQKINEVDIHYIAAERGRS